MRHAPARISRSQASGRPERFRGELQRRLPGLAGVPRRKTARRP